MYLSHISGQNVKARSFDHPLAPVTMILGDDNFTGKTAVMEAIRIVLFGHVPRLGKQPSSTMKLAGDLKNEMMVNGNFSDGTHITRTFTRTGKGKASSSSEGVELKIPSILGDIREYLEKTSSDRVKFIFDKVDLGSRGFDDDGILKRLGKIETLPAALSAPAVKRMLATAKSTIALRDRNKSTIQEWLEYLIKQFTVEEAACKNEANRKSEEQTALHKQLPPKTPKSNAAEIVALEQKVRDLTSQKQAVMSALEAWRRTETRRSELNAIIANPAGEPTDLAKSINQTTAEIQARRKTLSDLNARLSQLRVKRKGASDKFSELSARINEAKRAASDLTAQTQCPYCKSAGKGWKETATKEYQATIEIASTEQTGQQSIITAVDQEGSAFKAQVAAIEAELSILDANLKADNESLVAQTKLWRDYEAAKQELASIDTAAPKPDTANLEVWESELTSIQKHLADLKIAETDFNQFAALKARKEAVEAEAIAHQVTQKIYKLAREEVVAIQQELIGDTIGAVLEKAQALTDGILIAPLQWRNGEIGMFIDQSWASYEVFSGTEEALSFAAFSVAMAQESPIKIVLIDEMDRIKPERRLAFLQKAHELVQKGVIDQFVGVGLESNIYEDLVKAGSLHLVRIGE